MYYPVCNKKIQTAVTHSVRVWNQLYIFWTFETSLLNIESWTIGVHKIFKECGVQSSYIVQTCKLHHEYLISTTYVSKYKWFVYACMYVWMNRYYGHKKVNQQVTDSVVTTLCLQVTIIVCM